MIARLIGHLAKLVELVLKTLERIGIYINLTQLVPHEENRADRHQSQDHGDRDHQGVHTQQTFVLEGGAVGAGVLRRAEAARGLEAGVVAAHSVPTADVVLDDRAIYVTPPPNSYSTDTR